MKLDKAVIVVTLLVELVIIGIFLFFCVWAIFKNDSAEDGKKDEEKLFALKEVKRQENSNCSLRIGSNEFR